MKSPVYLTAFLFITTAVLTGCSDQDGDSRTTDPVEPGKPAPATRSIDGPAPRILDTFHVGNNIYVRSLKVEPETNSLWVGTSTGVMQIDLNSRELLRTFTRDHGLANEYVFGIGIDSRGYKWFGTNAGGVSRYKNGEWKTYFPMHGLADYWIYSFAEQKNGKFWIGTWAGVNQVDLKTMQFTTYVKELINEWVYGIDVDSRDRVWFGTEGGVSMFDGQTWTHWTHADGMGADNSANLPISANTGLGTRSRHDLSVLEQGKETYNPNYVFSVLVLPDDKVLVGTWGGGVSRFDGSNWNNLTTSEGLAGNIVYSIAREENGILWFGTNHGLSRYDGQNWHTYDRADGLLGDDVYAIATTHDGEIWVGTLGGVVRIGNQPNPAQEKRP